MRIVIQRVANAKVVVSGEVISKIGTGLLLLVCVENHDHPITLNKIVDKILNLRIFPDEQQKMNLNIQQIQGEILSISQFTLSWKGEGGNRPSFSGSMSPERANQIYLEFCEKLNLKVPTLQGVFAAHMEVALTNDGPVTFCLDF